jgi:glucose-6-phosphate 1-dehydrogenase
MAKNNATLEPSIIVIFGITGDLSQRYLLPALYHLLKDGLLNEQTEIVGISRREVSTEKLFENVELCVNEVDKTCDPVVLRQLHEQTRMVQLDLTDAEGYKRLRATLDDIEAENGVCMNRLYYLSIPPAIYGSIIQLMGEADLNTSCQHDVAETRLLIEKPFGYDLESARELIWDMAQIFNEQQIFRIDHYLAKETVQNILAFRFQNPIFEAVWNREHIARIEIFASEKIGIEGRAVFYEPLGALRDFIQSHLLQLLAIVTMGRPDTLDSDNIHTSKQAVMEQVKAVPADQVAKYAQRLQYEGYRQEVEHDTSVTETFAAVKVFIDNPRWEGVPITLWTGKGLDEKRTEVAVCFKSGSDRAANRLRFRIQPNEGIELDLLTKKPGFESDLQNVAMDFSYQNSFGPATHSNAYERVLVDAVKGDHTLFATSQEVLEAWRIVQPVLDAWEKGSEDLGTYPYGTSGDDLVKPLIG